tara:strand:+ start:1804 stop:3372 length:1569 start_codon:yes stop_codon:yes gene_type:complete
MLEKLTGTLAIDLGNTNTVITFQDEKYDQPILIEIPNITKAPGIIPTAIWNEEDTNTVLIGMEALEKFNEIDNNENFYSNFKRLIGNPYEEFNQGKLTPEQSAEKFMRSLWDSIPNEFIINRLVLTAPIDTYKGYRKWLINICNSFSVKEIALVDEPTAAAIGMNVPFGSTIMVLDVGGSTIDLNIVKIEGGEGKSAPIAELLKFNDKDVSKISKQKLRCAEIISKSACKIGGKDFDQWILNHFLPNNKDARNLKIAEKLKCLLSEKDINSEQQYCISFYIEENIQKEFFISKKIFEDILISNNLINLLNTLLKRLLNDARGKDYKINDLFSIILVGGGTQIPLIRNWIEYKIPEIKIDFPPPIESISLGALSLTPGVKIKDILNKSLFLRLFNKRDKKHFWHPIFYKGQTWPTEKPYELILQSSKADQLKFEIIIGETSESNDFDVIYENGIPKLAEIQREEKVLLWDKSPLFINIKSPASLGCDCLKLLFWIDDKSFLNVQWVDIAKNETGKSYKLGEVL